MNNKDIDMSAFVDIEFDLQWLSRYPSKVWNTYVQNERIEGETVYMNSYPVRPRLNKPQVLDDWSWVPEGLVWNVASASNYRLSLNETIVNSSGLRDMHFFFYASCIGVEANKGYDKWAERHGMELIEL